MIPRLVPEYLAFCLDYDLRRTWYTDLHDVLMADEWCWDLQNDLTPTHMDLQKVPLEDLSQNI